MKASISLQTPDDSICPKNDAIHGQNEECKGGCERSGWIEDISREHRNTKYYRDIVVNIGALFGDDAYIQDDGNRTDSVLCAKVLELATSAMATKQKLETEAGRLRVDAARYRWLREYGGHIYNDIFNDSVSFNSKSEDATYLDAAIDAALEPK